MRSDKLNRGKTTKSLRKHSKQDNNTMKTQNFVVNSVPTQPTLASTIHLASGVSLIKTKDSNASIAGPRKHNNHDPHRLSRSQYNKYVESIRHTINHQAKAPLVSNNLKRTAKTKSSSKIIPKKKIPEDIQTEKENFPSSPAASLQKVCIYICTAPSRISVADT